MAVPSWAVHVVPEKLDAGIESKEIVSPEVTGGDAKAGEEKGRGNRQRPMETTSALRFWVISRAYFFTSII